MRRLRQLVALAFAHVHVSGIVLDNVGYVGYDAAKRLPNLRALYMTSVHPVDIMPIDEVVKHHIRSLEEPNIELTAIVYNNTPPMLTDSAGLPARLQFRGVGAQDYALQKLVRKSQNINFKVLDYSRAMTDPQYLNTVFEIEDIGNSTLRELSRDNQHFGNFVAMYTYLLECLSSETELCIYLDPDILLYRNTSGLLNVAAGAFRQNPEMVMMSPPFGCHNQAWPMRVPRTWGSDNPANEGSCHVNPFIVSSRHLIINRTRFADLLPLKANCGQFGLYIEELLTRIVNREDPKRAGQLMCGWEYFAVHPPSRFQRKSNKNFTFVDLLTQLAGGPGGAATVDAETARKGAHELIKRFESGSFKLKKGGAGESLQNDACNCCADMVPSADRIKKGLAFAMDSKHDEDEFESAFQTSVNDATFEWVAQCGA